MDFDKTSFSVDWFTPGDKYCLKRLSFPKSACISIDDLAPDSPLSFCFTPVDEAIVKPPTHSIVDTTFERACGWTNNAPPPPIELAPREPYPMYGQDPKTSEESLTDWRALASPGLVSIADDCASCGVDLDVSCLDALDEQLLLSPVECFIDLCWAAAVHDDVSAPIVRRNTRSRARSFKQDRERVDIPAVMREYPGSFDRTRPSAAKVALPLDTCPHLVSSSPSSKSHGISVTHRERPLLSILYPEPEGLTLGHHPTRDAVSRYRKRDLPLTPSVESFTRSKLPPTPPRLKTSKSSYTLRVLGDACATFARPGKKSPLASP